MSEEQEKPAKKWYTIRRVYLFICMLVILLMIAGIVVMSIGGSFTYVREYTYDTAKVELQNAVKDYQNKNNGALPTVNGTVTINSSTYNIANICPLLTQNGGEKRTFLDCIWSGNRSADDNCDGGCAGCRATNHYIWAVDGNGSVYSTCVGDACEAHNQNGYQGVWP